MAQVSPHSKSLEIVDEVENFLEDIETDREVQESIVSP